MYIALETYF